MSIRESAQALASAADATYEATASMVQQGRAQLDTLAAITQQLKTAAEDSTTMAATLIGEGHPGTEEIVGAAAAMVANVEALQDVLGLLGTALGNAEQDTQVLWNTMAGVAQRLLGS